MIAVTAPAVPVWVPMTTSAAAIALATIGCGKQRPQLVGGRVGRFAGRGRAQTSVGEEVADGDHGRSERDDA